MDLRLLKENWNLFGLTDPLWAILAHSDRKGNLWKIEEFFKTGEQWISEMMRELSDHGLSPTGRCLDFGCGVGRLTQALCNYFETCDGIDIAPSMIELARRYNRHGSRCRYHINDAPDIKLFADGSFGFVCSMIVLQHMVPLHSKRYIAEFVRLLQPGGVAYFQIPSAPLEISVPFLPVTAYKTRIVPLDQRLVTFPCQRLIVRAHVRNDSHMVWVASSNGARLRLGNHWLKGNGELIQNDDGRAELPELKPRQETLIALPVTTPNVEGDLFLELDLVNEGVSWFAQGGFIPPRIPVANRRPRRQRLLQRLTGGHKQSSDTEHSTSAPVMEMHCIPQDEVVDIVTNAGAQIIDIRRDGAAGNDFESFHYIIARPRDY